MLYRYKVTALLVATVLSMLLHCHRADAAIRMAINGPSLTVANNSLLSPQVQQLVRVSISNHPHDSNHC